MKIKSNKYYWVTALLILIVVLNTLCFTNNTSDDNKYKPPAPDEKLGILYLSKSNYLLPTEPGKGSENLTTLTPSKPLFFSHNIRDRKFNAALTPELNLWINARGQGGVKLEFEIGFQGWENNTLIEGYDYKILFENYTTSGLLGVEQVNVKARKYEGTPFDIKYGTTNWSGVYLMINITQNFTYDTSVDIYCGAGGKISYIKLPYDRTLSAYEYEQKSKKK